MEEHKLRGFDYIACVWFADSITVGLLSGNIFVLIFGILSYILYENWRRGEDE